MVRNDYIDGQSFPFPKWNSLALLNDNITTFNNNIYTTYYSGLSLVGVPVVIDGALTSTDVLNGEVANLQTNSDFNEEFSDALKAAWTTEVNPDQANPAQIVNTIDVQNALNITETETLSWYDSDQQDAVNSLFINEQMEIYESGYTRDALINESPATLTEVSKNFVEGSIWQNDLTKTHEYSANRYRQWSNPDKTLLVDITHPTLAVFDTTFDTTKPWEFTRVENAHTNVNFDGTHLYVYRFQTIGFFNEFSDEWDLGVAFSYIVSKIDLSGNIVSENQYNYKPTGNYLANAPLNNSVDIQGRGVTSTQLSNDSILYSSLNQVDVEEDGNHRDFDLLTVYGKATPTGWQNNSTNVNANSFDQDTGENFKYVGNVVSSVANSSIQMNVLAYYEEEEQSDGDEASRLNLFAVVVDGGTLSLKTYFRDTGYDDTTNNSLSINSQVNHTDCEIYVAARDETTRAISGPNPETSWTGFLKASTAGISLEASVTNSGSTAFRYTAYSYKMCPNYVTNSLDVYYKYDKTYTDGVTPTESFYFQLGVGAISEGLYNAVIANSIYSLSGNVTNGLAGHGITYSMGVDDDTAGYFHTGRPGQHQSVVYDIINKEFTSTESMPAGVRTYFLNT